MLAPAAHQNPILMSPELKIASQYNYNTHSNVSIALILCYGAINNSCRASIAPQIN